MAPSFKPLKAGEEVLDRVQESLARCLNFLLGAHDIDRRLLEDTGNGLAQGIALSAATTYVAHGLGRAWKGFRVVSLNAAATVYYDTTPTQDTGLFIGLKASGACTVKLEVW